MNFKNNDLFIFVTGSFQQNLSDPLDHSQRRHTCRKINSETNVLSFKRKLPTVYDPSNIPHKMQKEQNVVKNTTRSLLSEPHAKEDGILLKGVDVLSKIRSRAYCLKTSGKNTYAPRNVEISISELIKDKVSVQTFEQQIKEQIGNVDFNGLYKALPLIRNKKGVVSLLKGPNTVFDDKKATLAKGLEVLQKIKDEAIGKKKSGENTYALRSVETSITDLIKNKIPIQMFEQDVKKQIGNKVVFGDLYTALPLIRKMKVSKSNTN